MIEVPIEQLPVVLLSNLTIRVQILPKCFYIISTVFFGKKNKMVLYVKEFRVYFNRAKTIRRRLT